MLKLFEGIICKIERIVGKIADKKEKELVEQAAWAFYWRRKPDQIIFAENSRPDIVIGFVEGVNWYKDHINNLSKGIVDPPENPKNK